MFKVIKIEFIVDVNGEYVLRWYWKEGKLTRFHVSKTDSTSPIQVKDMLNLVDAFANQGKTILVKDKDSWPIIGE